MNNKIDELARYRYWSMTEGVFNCLIDTRRTRAFSKAIENTVRKGDIVVDMGSGTGVLALIAANASAKKVYAIEIDNNNAKTLRNTIDANGFTDIIEVIELSVLEAKLPEKVDVVICEMVATALIEELQVPAMNYMHKFMNKDARVILKKYETYVDLVKNQNKFYGLDFNIIRYEYPDEPGLKSMSYSKPYKIDKYKFNKIVNNLHVNKEIPIRINKDGMINGIRLSGITTFSDGSKLASTFAYSYPIILPVVETKVKASQVIYVTLNYFVSGGIENLEYSIIVR